MREGSNAVPQTFDNRMPEAYFRPKPKDNRQEA